MTSIKSLRYTILHFLFSWWHRLLNRWHLILRPGVVLGTLFLAVIIGLLVAQGRVKAELLLAVLVAPSGLLILYRLGRFEYGILLILLSAGAIRFAISATQWSKIVTSLMVTMGLVGIWLLQMLLYDKKIQVKPSPLNKPLLTFIAVSIIAYLWGNIFRDPLVILWGSFPIVQVAALMVNILLPILTLLVANKIQEVKWLKWLTVILLSLGTIAIIAREFGLSALTHDVYPFARNFIFALHDRGLFVAWVGALAYALALFDESLSWQKRGLLLALVAAWVHYSFILSSSWVTGWLPLMVTCAAITFMRSKKLFLLVGIIGSIYLMINFNYYWETIVLAEEAEGSGTERVTLWERNLDHIVKHPLFGMGPAGYAVYNMTYHPEDARSTHNNYFDIAAQTGIIGLGVFLWLFITFIRMAGKLRQALSGHRNFEEAFANAAQGACIGAMVAMMLGDWVLPFAYNQGIAGFDNASYTWLFLGAMVSLYHIVKAKGNTSQRTLPE
ncbi:MAG: O-antigen ligase family protein [Chloroflexi bacterium]|nr:O-antigen ligase family protein [Chloroflexota bacterium]